MFFSFLIELAYGKQRLARYERELARYVETGEFNPWGW